MAYFGGSGSTAFPATQTVQLEKAFRKRFRDQSIMPLLTNSEWKGRFRGTGTTIEIPVLPVLHTYKTAPGEQVKYQTPKGSKETFTINRERAWGIHFLPEDKMFADFGIESPVLDEQSKVMGEDIEYEFLQDIPDKCHAANKGDTTTGKAGYMSGGYKIGSATTPCALYKKDSDLPASGLSLAAPDYFAHLAGVLTEQPGGKNGSWRCVIPTAVGVLLQTSELKQAELTGDATTTLRKSVRDIGNLAGMDLIQSDKIPVQEDDDGNKIYTIYALDTTAITFAEEAVVKEKIQDKDDWGDFQRCKMIYDWFVRYPERFAVGYVKIGA